MNWTKHPKNSKHLIAYFFLGKQENKINPYQYKKWPIHHT